MLLKGDPKIILREEHPILLDEWQLLPEIWTFVRHQVDKGLPAGSVLSQEQHQSQFPDP